MNQTPEARRYSVITQTTVTSVQEHSLLIKQSARCFCRE